MAKAPRKNPQPKTGASAARRRRRVRVGSWIANHRSVAASSLANLMESWVSSLMTWLVIGIALALPALLYLLLANIGDVSEGWDGKPRISVYLKQAVTDEQARAFANRVRDMSQVANVRYISRESALTEFTRMSGFGDVLQTLDKNPLPPVVEVEPVNTAPGQVKLLTTNISRMDEVDDVDVDLAWIERLYAILSLGQRFVTALAFFLALGVVLSIGNTIRLAIENRRAEIEVVKLVGGTDSFVRRPFLYLGFWYGFGGALLAWVMVQGSLWFLSGPVDRLVQSYNDAFSLLGLGFGTTLLLLLTGSILGILGAAIAVRRHLHAIEPS